MQCLNYIWFAWTGLQIFFKTGGPKWPMEQKNVGHFLKWWAQAYPTNHSWHLGSILQGFPGRRILRLLLSKTSLGPPKNYHVRPLGLVIICEEVERINDYVFKCNSCIKFGEFTLISQFVYREIYFCNIFFLQQATSHKSIRKGKFLDIF